MMQWKKRVKNQSLYHEYQQNKQSGEQNHHRQFAIIKYNLTESDWGQKHDFFMALWMVLHEIDEAKHKQKTQWQAITSNIFLDKP